MTYQVKYNTNDCKHLLELLIFIIDNKQITVDDFIEVTGLSDKIYGTTMRDFNQMLPKLDLNISSLKSTVLKPEEPQNKVIYYYNVDITDPYKYNIDNLTQEELIKYSLVIVYLMLKNEQYVTPITLSRIFPNFNNKTMFYLKENLLDVIADDIDKNKYQSYILVDFD